MNITEVAVVRRLPVCIGGDNQRQTGRGCEGLGERGLARAGRTMHHTSAVHVGPCDFLGAIVLDVAGERRSPCAGLRHAAELRQRRLGRPQNVD
jgi:hypothetical protein